MLAVAAMRLILLIAALYSAWISEGEDLPSTTSSSFDRVASEAARRSSVSGSMEVFDAAAESSNETKNSAPMRKLSTKVSVKQGKSMNLSGV